MSPFSNFQSILNRYYIKLKGTHIENALVTPKIGLSSVQPPKPFLNFVLLLHVSIGSG
jgi:hypothetical protein